MQSNQGPILIQMTTGGRTVKLRRVGERRFQLHLSYEDAPGFVRVFLALSLRHLAELLRNHVPAQCLPEISSALARALVAAA